MKKSQLQQIIREEINNVLKEETPAEKEKVLPPFVTFVTRLTDTNLSFN
jgi:hypothetical protein